MKSEFVVAVGKGLYEAISTDPDVFLMATAGLLLSSKRTQGFGKALGLYVSIRRLDQIAAHFAQLKVEELKLAEQRANPPLFNPPA